VKQFKVFELKSSSSSCLELLIINSVLELLIIN